MVFHKSLVDIHIIQAFEFADEAARLAGPYVTADIGKVVRQLDDDSWYVLLSTTPTFLQLGGSGGAAGPAGGDLDGYYPDPQVVDLTITGEEQGSVLYFDGSNWVQLSPSTDGYVLTTRDTGADPEWASPTGGPPSGAAGGDLGGTYPNPEVNDLTIAGEEQGSILYFDGSNWVHLPPGDDGYVLSTEGTGANPVWVGKFGPEFAHVQDDTPASTSSTLPINYITLTTDVVPAGVYRLGFSYTWRHSSGTNDFIGEIVLDSTTNIIDHQQEPKDAGGDQRYLASGFVYLTFSSSASHTFDFNFYTSANLPTAFVFRAALEFWRVA